MARRSKPGTPKAANLTAQQMTAAIPKLRRRIIELQAFDVESISRRDDPALESLEMKIDSTLVDVFGTDTIEYERYHMLTLDRTSYNLMQGTSLGEIREGYQRGIAEARSGLETVISLFEETIEDSGETPPGGSPVARPPAVAVGPKVFLVHGHDESALHLTARFIEGLGLDPVILHEQPNEGRTIIEKFVDYADVGFAVVLLTPDDQGAPMSAPSEDLQPRARQNVILELGYFLGKLGRSRVCALYCGGVEIPSDYKGVIFLPLDDSGGWRLTLARELKAAGFAVDMNRAV